MGDKQPACMFYKLTTAKFYKILMTLLIKLVIANGLNKKEFRYLLLSDTGYGFELNVLNRVSKIGTILS